MTKESGKGKDGGKNPTIKQLGMTEAEGQETAPQSQRTLKTETSDPKEPELEPERVISAFQEMMIKSLKKKASKRRSRQPYSFTKGKIERKCEGDKNQKSVQ